jgi:soluble lytic murein transglycosylase-like protein
MPLDEGGCGRSSNRFHVITGRGLRFLAMVLACAVLLPLGGTVAHADVLEIGDDGTVHVRSGNADALAANASETIESAPPLPVDAITPVATLDVPGAWRDRLESAAAHYRVSPQLLAALVWQESRWHPGAVSRKGAVGLAQLMPGTAQTLAVNARDPAANLDGGAHYLRQMLDLFDGDVERALAAYNAGPRRVLRAHGLPPIAETRTYVSTIIDRLTPVLSTGLSK